MESLNSGSSWARTRPWAASAAVASSMVIPVRLGTTRGCGPADSTTATVVSGVTVSPAFNPGCSGTIQLITVPAGTVSSNAGSGLLQHQAELLQAGSCLFECQSDQIGQWSRRRTGADDELERLALLENGGLGRLRADDDACWDVVTGFAGDDGVPVEPGDLVERLGLGEPGEMRHRMSVGVGASDEIGGATGGGGKYEEQRKRPPDPATTASGHHADGLRSRVSDVGWSDLFNGRHILGRHRGRCF